MSVLPAPANDRRFPSRDAPPDADVAEGSATSSPPTLKLHALHLVTAWLLIYSLSRDATGHRTH
jgi:hypothetical protein